MMYAYRHRDGGTILATPASHKSPDSIVRQPGWVRAPELDVQTATERGRRFGSRVMAEARAS